MFTRTEGVGSGKKFGQIVEITRYGHSLFGREIAVDPPDAVV
jgi:hypothetical protein